MRKWLFYFLAFVCIFSCNRKNHDNIIPRRILVPLLVDIHTADALAMNGMLNEQFGGLDSSLLYQAVFEKYGYTKEEFDRTLQYYSSDPEKLIEIYDDVFTELSKRSEEAKELYGSTTGSRTNLIWKPDQNKYFIHGDTMRYPPAFDFKIDTTGIFVLSAEIKITPHDKSVNPRILAYFYNPFHDDPKSRIYFEETALPKSNYLRDYTLLKECNDTSLSRMHIIIPMHDTPDSVFNKAFDMQNLRVSLYRSGKKR
jgi:hypothetical protein